MDMNQQMLNLHKHLVRFISINVIIFILVISSDRLSLHTGFHLFIWNL